MLQHMMTGLRAQVWALRSYTKSAPLNVQLGSDCKSGSM